jgi:hypothetical protein
MQITLTKGCSTTPAVITLSGDTRYKNGRDTLPCGVTYPGSFYPCGVFFKTFTRGLHCSDSGATYSTSIGLRIHCTGIGWQMEAYCYSVADACWVDSGAVTDITDVTTNPDCGPILLTGKLPDPLVCCCPDAVTDCCPCTDGDGKIVEVTFTPAGGGYTLVCSSENSGTDTCVFTLDGCNDGSHQVNGGGQVTCSADGTWSISAITDNGAGGDSVNWTTPSMSYVVNSCDPLDVTFTGTQGTVTMVQL